MHITITKQNVPPFSFFQTKSLFLVTTTILSKLQNLQIESNQKNNQNASILSINRLTGKTQQIKRPNFQDLRKAEDTISRKQIWCIYGIIVINYIPYLALIDQIRKIKSIKMNPIYQVKNVSFICFDPNKNPNIIDQEVQYLDFIKNSLIKENFYFSFEENLTLSFKKKIIKKQMDSKYFWNQKATQFLVNAGINKPWIVPIIQGHVNVIAQKQFQYRIISRRSKYMSGTRYNCRGLGPDGQASNFVETQQIIVTQKYIFSQISIRGSVPIFWSQSDGFAQIRVTTNLDKNIKGLKKHYQSLSNDYQCSINTVNLLSVNKQSQDYLSKQFTQILEQHNKNYYFKFDFNNRYKILNVQIDAFIQQYEKKQSINNFQCYDIQQNQKINQQHFIPRINCLDCIDRTNVIMSRIGEKFFDKVLKILNIKIEDQLKQKYLDNWVQLGNKISQLYCGTSSVAQHIVLKKQASSWTTITSSIRSVNRFLNASINDNFKEQCNKYLLNDHYKSEYEYFSQNVAIYALKKEQFCDFSQTEVVFLTWNVAAESSLELTFKDKQILQQKIFGNVNKIDNSTPDAIFITLQQIVQLNTINIMTNDSSQVENLWSKTFQKILNSNKRYNNNESSIYRLYFSQSLVGITSFLFVKNSQNPKKDYLNRISKCFSFQVKRGMGGNLGNKGSIVSGFYIDDSLIINFACHLAAHDQKFQDRQNDINGIFQSLQNSKDKKIYKYYKMCDFMFFTGDLNFRLFLPDQEVRQTIHDVRKIQQEARKQSQSNLRKNQILKHLSKKCEYFNFHKLKNQKKKLFNFEQKDITFYPTYKYQKNADVYDIKRKPGYCDRILHYQRISRTLKCLIYDSINQIKLSDHRPVIAKYILWVKSENKVKKDKLIDEYLNYKTNSQKVIQSPKYILPKSHYYNYN